MSNSRLQQGYVRLHLAVPKPIADRFKERCVSRGPRGMKKLGAVAISICNGLSDEAIDELVNWALMCENSPQRSDPEGGAKILSSLITGAAAAVSDGGYEHYIDRIIDPGVMGRDKDNKKDGVRKNAG